MTRTRDQDDLEKCRKCGEMIPELSVSCPECGVDEPSEYRYTAKRKRARLVRAVIGVFVLANAFGFWLIFRDATSPPSPVEAPPAGDFIVWMEAGAELYKKGRYSEAIECYTKALKIKPTEAWVYSVRGIAHGRRGKQDEAIADFSRAMELDPKDGGNYLMRSVAYADQGEKEKSFADLKKACVLGSRDACNIAAGMIKKSQ